MEDVAFQVFRYDGVFLLPVGGSLSGLVKLQRNVFIKQHSYCSASPSLAGAPPPCPLGYTVAAIPASTVSVL